ncbi:hypothetical protein HDV02_004618 [Globomyces sp. JEL0801]|nr:hypothetical protein HDV02_004618 [Globomyces sp. JEL0801]
MSPLLTQMDIQSITQSLQKGTVDQKKQAIVECIPLSEDVGTFATTLLPYILPLHSIQELRVDILLLLENLILNCSRSTCGDPIKFAVLASAIEAVVVILSDPKIEMQNRAIGALGNIYPYAFKILYVISLQLHSCEVPGDAKYWSIISELKRYIDAQFENVNEGIRANSLLFLQNMILSQTPSLSENYLLSFGIIQPNFTPVAVAEPAIVDEPTMVEEEVEAEVDQLPQIDLEIDVDAILAASYEYSDEESHQLVLDSYKRILNMEAHFTVSGKGKTVVIPDAKDTVIASKYGWMLLISRMLTRTNADNEAKSAFSQFVFERFHSRMDLAILWLCEEFSADSIDESSNGYQIWFHNMLDMLKGGDVDPSHETFTGLDPRDRAFTKFLVEVPQLTEYAMTRIHEYCRDSARPAVRDEYSDIRSNAVAAAKTFVPGHETIGPIVKEKAISNFDKLFQYTKVENTDEEDGEVVQGYVDEVLLAKVNSSLFDLCHKLPENVFKCLSVAIVPIFKEFFVDPDYLFQLIQDFPEGSESLVLVLIKSLMSNEDLEQRAIEETKTIFQKRNLGVNFLLLIIKSLDKESILLNLGKLVDSLDESEAQAAIVKSVFVSLVEVPVSENMEETAKALLTPAELLVKLHNLEDSVGLKKVLEACNICFSEPLIYKEDALGTVLNQLSNQIKLPTLFMRTVLQSISAFKGFGVNSILTRLITKQIWTNPQLWNGFIRCCTITFPASIPVLLALPDAQGKDVLENSPKLKTGLTEYLDRLPDHQQGRREFIQLSALLSSS